MHLQWLTQHGIPFTLIVEYIPLLATVTTTILSIVLARATLRYAEASDKSLALAREEFERQWSPELHIKLERISSRQTKIVVTNLGKISVLLPPRPGWPPLRRHSSRRYHDALAARQCIRSSLHL